MGYSLYIGEASIEVEADECYIGIDVKTENHDKAPAYGEPTDNSNMRWPSYTSWLKFCKFVDLYDMFFEEDCGLMREHPGVTPLNKKHKEKIDKAMADFKKKYPNSIAGYSPKIDEKNDVYEDKDWPEENNYLVRLEWLKYWVDWALENCKIPVFKNI